MPQLFQVLRCYKCLTFQVHQTKKSNKWECKVCSEKQSVKRHYGIGTAKDCRQHVQKLNTMRGEKDELKCGQMLRNCKSDEEGDIEVLESIEFAPQIHPVSSKWSDYLEVPETVEENEPMCLGDAEVVLEIPKKRRKLLTNYCKSNRNTVSVTPAVSHSIDYGTHTTEKILTRWSNNQNPQINDANVEDVKIIKPVNLLEHRTGKENQNSNLSFSKNIPPVTGKYSKWAEYIEDEDSDSKPSTSVDVSHHGHMFSLCNDSELDSILDI